MSSYHRALPAARPYTDAAGNALSGRMHEILRAVIELATSRRGEWLSPAALWEKNDTWSQARRDGVRWLSERGALSLVGLEQRYEGRRLMFRLPAECEGIGKED